MELREIKQIIELMRTNDLSHFELERDGMRIKLKKGMDLDALAEQMAALQPQPAPEPVAAAPAIAPPEPVAEPEPKLKIEAPMVGTFYRSSKPGEAPLVKVGDAVDEDTVVCIIEAMKVMNEIKAEIKGKVGKILIDDSKPVQYGEPLFEIAPA